MKVPVPSRGRKVGCSFRVSVIHKVELRGRKELFQIVCLMPHPEELAQARALSQRFGCKCKEDEALKSMGMLAVQHVEARFILTIADQSMTAAAKKRKLEHLVSKVGDHAKAYGVDAKSLLLRCLLTMSMNSIMTPR